MSSPPGGTVRANPMRPLIQDLEHPEDIGVVGGEDRFLDPIEIEASHLRHDRPRLFQRPVAVHVGDEIDVRAGGFAARLERVFGARAAIGLEQRDQRTDAIPAAAVNDNGSVVAIE